MSVAWAVPALGAGMGIGTYALLTGSAILLSVRWGRKLSGLTKGSLLAGTANCEDGIDVEGVCGRSED